MKYYPALVLRMVASLVLVFSRDLLALVITPLSAFLSFVPLFLFFGAQMDDFIITLQGSSIEFVAACAAVEAYILLGLLVLLTKDLTFNKGIKLFFVGSGLILLANVLRIMAMMLLLVHNQINLFLTLHLVIWHVVSSVYVVLVWFFLVHRYNIKTIPVWSDITYLYEKSLLRK